MIFLRNLSYILVKNGLNGGYFMNCSDFDPLIYYRIAENSGDKYSISATQTNKTKHK